MTNLVILVVGTVLAIVASQSRSGPTMRQAATGLLFLLMIAAPFFTPATSLLFDALTAMAIAYGWNVIGGYTGYAAFGNVAYLGLGAFVAAGFMSRQPGHPALPWFVGIPLAVAIVAAFAAVIGLFVLRLRGHYFSIATLGVSVAMPQFIQWEAPFGREGLIPNFFGGGLPLNFPLAADVTIGGFELGADRFFFYYLGLATALIGWGVTVALNRSKFGYGLIAIRENEEAAEVMGVNTTVAKSGAYALSAALAGLGGSVIGYRLTNMTTEAEALFSVNNNLQMIIICLIGGIGTLWGPWIGAFILFALQEGIRLVASGDTVLHWQATVLSLLIVLVVLFMPYGVLRVVQDRARAGLRLAGGRPAYHRA
jgi:branched-chain amino acid transport system permease protein